MVQTIEEISTNGRGIYRRENSVKCRTQQKQSGLGPESPENSFSDKLRVSENTFSGFPSVHYCPQSLFPENEKNEGKKTVYGALECIVISTEMHVYKTKISYTVQPTIRT